MEPKRRLYCLPSQRIRPYIKALQIRHQSYISCSDHAIVLTALGGRMYKIYKDKGKVRTEWSHFLLHSIF